MTDSPAAQTLADLSPYLQPRDRVIASLLYEHTTLTTDQLAAVLFESPTTTTARHRLHALRRMEWIDRFIRNRPGAPNPACWLPGLFGARFMALAREETPPTARALRDRKDRAYANPNLKHLLAVNDFFTALLVHARHHPDADLTRWWSERTTTAYFGNGVRPDGHGVWTERGRQTGFYLELDRGNESHSRLIEKLQSHRALRAEGGPRYPILFVLPTRTREQNLHRRLADRPVPGVTVATTSPESGTDPAGPVWRLVGNGRQRDRLADLPSSHGQPGAYNPGPPEPADHPLRFLREST